MSIIYKMVDMESINDIYNRLWKSDFTKEISAEGKRCITEFLSFLTSIPKEAEEEFVKEFLQVRYAPSMLAAVFLAYMREITLEKAAETFCSLTDKKDMPKISQIISAVSNTYSIKVIDKKTIFGKRKVDIKFPKDFYKQVDKDFKALPPREKKKFTKTGDDWNDFVDWWGEVDEDELKDDLHLGAYQLMWYYNEVLNGGYDQFFDNKSDWDFEKTTHLFKEILPKKELDNYEKALKNFKNDKDNEDLNAEFEEELVQSVLEKIAKKIIKGL